MKRSRISLFADSSSVSQWIERLFEVLFLIPLCLLAKDALFALVPVTVLYRFLLDFACVYLPFSLGGLMHPLLRKKKARRIMELHRCGMSTMLAVGITAAVLLMLSAGALSSWLLGAGAPESDISLMKSALYLFAPLITAECLLSVFRGTDLGMRRPKGYLVTVIAEQLLRCIFVAVFCVVVKGETGASAQSVMLASGSSLAASLFPLAFYIWRAGGLLTGTASRQEAVLRHRITQKMIPSFMNALTDHLWLLFDMAAAIPLSLYFGMEYAAAKQSYGIVLVQCLTVSLIPVLLTFHIVSGALVPLEKALEAGDGDGIESRVVQAFCRSLKLIIPCGVFIALHADAVAGVLFGIHDGNAVYFSICGIFAVVYSAAAFSSQMMDALHLRRKKTGYCLLAFVLKVLAVYPLMQKFQMMGLLFSSIFYFAVVLILNLSRIKNRTLVEYGKIGSTVLRILVACCAMHGVVYGLSLLGITGTQQDPSAVWNFAVMVAAGAAAYYMTGDILKIFRFRRIS